MLHNRKKNVHKFKSYTDIHNYNNFLLELDKKQLLKNKNTYFENNEDVHLNTNTKKSDIFVTEKNNQNTKINTNNLNNQKMDRLMKTLASSVDTSYKDVIFNKLLPKLLALENITDPNLYEQPESNTIKESPLLHSPVNVEKKTITSDINNIGDLLSLIEKYPISKNVEYNINMESLHKIKTPLTELNNMIGMNSLKENIVDQIIFYIQNLHTLNSDIKGNDFMHTVIYGPPGTGKTEIAKIIGSIFSKIGILNKETFKKVTRADLVAGYLGQTSLKTREVIKNSLGGVLFIDEAYALGNDEKQDSFSKECIDTLCEALSDHKDNLMVIIAGYESDLNNCFFNYNQGLNSRFTWRFKIDDYNATDLYKIFLKKVNDSGWFLAENSEIDVKWFEKNKKTFKFYGRDIETLFAKTKIAHSKRVFCLDVSVKKYLTMKDLDNGLALFLKNEDSISKEKESINKIISSMYI